MYPTQQRIPVTSVAPCQVRRDLAAGVAAAIHRTVIAKAKWEDAVKRHTDDADELSLQLAKHRADERRATEMLRAHIVRHGCTNKKS